MKITLVIPLRNEEQLLDELYERSMKVLQSISDDYEIIAVDDGSADNTLSRLVAYNKSNPKLKVLVLSKNFGHQSAYTAGLSYAKGDYVVMMDGDLQDPPELIKSMYDKLIAENLDVVYGKRTGTSEGFLKKMLTQAFNALYKRLSKTKASEDAGNFSIFNRKVLQAMLSLQERNRYLPGLRSFVGFNQDFVTYTRQDRSKGNRMKFSELFHLATDAIFSSSDLPIKLSLYSGLFGVAVFSIGLVYIFISKLMGIAPYGWSSLILSIYFFGSVQLVFIGILGEYIYRIYRETQNRPIFIVKEFIE